MKTKRFKYNYRKNSSKLHKKIGDTLRATDSPFGGYKIYQEYPVSRIDPDYKENSHAFDWVILDLYLVIEAHGAQHYSEVRFGGITQEEAEENLIAQKFRDTQKMDAAIRAGYTYIEIPYTDYKLIDSDYIWKLYQESKNPNEIKQQPKKEESEYKKQLKEKAREYRKEQYRRKKEWLDKLKE